ncbi:MFS transporter [Mangrovactinospora gilvigrisea]|uniref:MFS transporter n=1 Tax=Mangrovactinospora gilvigrisea TaxID=1428644 RepID=A0A1J7BSD0_9ACTN|nr:MFS transporter [Mangrovactinospora gilvigrisea]OIV36361.1 MFS transporter [Mangrovactinospora gilvigrisea]
MYDAHRPRPAPREEVVRVSPTERTGPVVATLALAGTVAAIMQTLVTPLIAELPAILHTDASNAAWVITVTLLAGGVCVPITGRLGDLFGKKRMLLVCAVPLIVGSVVCALSSSVLPMIVGRGLQGMGMGMVPLGIALLRDVVPAERLSGSIALVSASMGIGGGIGLPVAAAVAQYANWRVLFWGSAGLALLIGLLIAVCVPDSPAAARGQRFDLPGSLGLAVGVVALLLGISKGADWGWTSGTTLGLLIGAVVVLLGWGAMELRTREPLVDLRTTARPRVLLTNVASVFVGVGMYANMLITPQLMQLPKALGYGLGQSMLHTGLWMLPGALMMMLISPLGGKLSNARGPKFTLITGIVVIAAGYGLALPLMGSAWGLMIVGMVVNSGVGFAYGAMPALIMGAVPPAETAAANGFNTLMRSLGTTIGAAVVGVVLSQMTVTLGGHVLASENGFRTGLLVGCGVSVVAAVIAATIPGARAAGGDRERRAEADRVPANG